MRYDLAFSALNRILLFLLSNRRNAQYNVTASIHSFQQHGVVGTPPNSAAANMQLMPYTAAQKKPLDPDELSKLYSMNQYARPMLPPLNRLNFQTPVPAQMSLAQANTNSAQFLTTAPYLQQGEKEK